MLSYPFCFTSKHEVLYPRLSISGLFGDKTLRFAGVVEQSLRLELEDTTEGSQLPNLDPSSSLSVLNMKPDLPAEAKAVQRTWLQPLVSDTTASASRLESAFRQVPPKGQFISGKSVRLFYQFLSILPLALSIPPSVPFL